MEPMRSSVLRFANSTTLFEKDIKKIEKGNVTGGRAYPVQEQDEAEALALRKKEVF